MRNIIDSSAVVAEHCQVADSELKPYSRLKSNVEFRNSTLGEYSYVSSFSVVNKTSVGKFTSIAHGCFIGLWEHNTFVSTHSFYLYESSGGFVKGYKNYEKDSMQTFVGNDVWVGAGAIIRKGVNIGDGAIVGAGAVVTKNVEPYSIVVGNPARHLKYRFDENDRTLLLQTKWWDFSREQIQKMVDEQLFFDFNKFKNYIVQRHQSERQN